MALTWIQILSLENGKLVEAWVEAEMQPILDPIKNALVKMD